ncbi:hypothetical protein ABVT39_016355 [Epinephelus coioides]
MANNSGANFFKGASTRSKLATKSSLPPESVSSVETSERNPPPNKPKTDDTTAGRKNDDGNMFEEILKMNATLQVVAVDVVSTKELKDSVEDIQIRLGEVEQWILDIEDTNAEMEKNVDKCDKRLEMLWAGVEDLENRSRRNNVRMVGLKEGKEETGKMIQYVERIISEGLRLTGNVFEIEGAHRSLAPMPNPDKPLRTIMMRFIRSSARDKVLQVAKEKRGIEREGCNLSFFEDLTRELAEKRKAFIPVKRRFA